MRFRIALAAAMAIAAAPLGHRVGMLPVNAAAALLAAGILVSFAALARYNVGQCWYYFPRMTLDETLIFVQDQ